MTSPNKNPVKTRAMVDSDLPRVNEIDREISGGERVPTWPFSFETYWNVHRPKLSLVAESEGRVVGFIVGTITEVDQNQSVLNLRHTIERPTTHRRVGWIDMIGIDPHSQHMGVGRMLVTAFSEACQREDAVVKGIAKENDARLRSFLSAAGFKPTDLVVYEKD